MQLLRSTEEVVMAYFKFVHFKFYDNTDNFKNFIKQLRNFYTFPEFKTLLKTEIEEDLINELISVKNKTLTCRYFLCKYNQETMYEYGSFVDGNFPFDIIILWKDFYYKLICKPTTLRTLTFSILKRYQAEIDKVYNKDHVVKIIQ